MARPKDATIRSEALLQALDRALTSSDRRVLQLLVRHGNLPGTRPNHDLAAAFGDELAARGKVTDAFVRELCEVDEMRAQGNSGEAFLPLAGAHALASRILAGYDPKGSWRALAELAADTRKVVRDGVIAALTRLAMATPGAADEIMRKLGEWTTGFLPAAVALEMLAQRDVLERLTDVDALVARLEESTSLAEHASRAEERTQGRRRLLEVLGDVLPKFGARVPRVLAWLIERASLKQPEVRVAFEAALLGLTRAGIAHGDLDPLRRVLDDSAPPRRDPTTYVGTTRGRGRKAQRRSSR